MLLSWLVNESASPNRREHPTKIDITLDVVRCGTLPGGVYADERKSCVYLRARDLKLKDESRSKAKVNNVKKKRKFLFLLSAVCWSAAATWRFLRRR